MAVKKGNSKRFNKICQTPGCGIPFIGYANSRYCSVCKQRRK